MRCLNKILRYIRLIPLLPKIIDEKLISKLRDLYRKRELFWYWLSFRNTKKIDLVIVTGSDSSHFKSQCQFLDSLYLHEPDISVYVYNLGWTESQMEYMKNTYSKAVIRNFEFEKYPSYFNIKINAGEYAWKPVLYCDLFNELKTNLCWMDAGDIITEPLVWIRKIVDKHGFYSPRSTGDIRMWTHPGTLEYYDFPENQLNKPNLASGIVAMNYHNKKSRQLAEAWKAGALERRSIAPEGSSRANHRQDQAVLTVLAYKMDMVKGMPSRYYGFDVHKDK
jgi:hypothetical protein